jgi:hypothetical protein
MARQCWTADLTRHVPKPDAWGGVAVAVMQANVVLSRLLDMRLPLTFTPDNCDLIPANIGDAVPALGQGGVV